MQKSYQANAPRNDQMNEQTTHEQKGDQLIAKFSLRAKHEQWKPCWTEPSAAFGWVFSHTMGLSTKDF